MDVRRLEHRDDYSRWDAFVTACPEATFFHRAGWRDVISSTVRHPVHYLFTERNGTVSGVLPMAQVRSRLFGHKLVSLPFCVYGGVAAGDEESRAALLAQAGALARRLGVDFLELRNQVPVQGLPVSDRYVTFRRVLDPDPDRNMSAIPRKQRAMIRKGAAKGLTARHDGSVEEFFAVYAQSLRNLGTPVLPLRYFHALRQAFGDACEITTVEAGEGAAVAAVMSFYFRDEVLPYYGGGTDRARETAAYDFMYWELLVHALGRGSRVFDFGRSRQGTGSYRFKTHWGFEPEPLRYQYDLVRSSAIPNVTPDNPRYHAFIKVWQRLPLPVTTWIGPWLAKDLG
jgi:FemAB-related protein (PEP-CTERM system-associated)